MSEVKKENTFWRNGKLSQRHREWGIDCSATDIDALIFLEYQQNGYRNVRNSAIVEYKSVHAKETSPSQIIALDNLSMQAMLPFWLTRYSDDLSRYWVTPTNDLAKKILSATCELSEEEYVKLMYTIRGFSTVPDNILHIIRNRKYQMSLF